MSDWRYIRVEESNGFIAERLFERLRFEECTIHGFSISTEYGGCKRFVPYWEFWSNATFKEPLDAHTWGGF